MIRLSDDETGMLAGASGPAAALSMRVILTAARIQGAGRLVPIASAHVDSCLYHGPSSLDFARALLSGGGRVRVPTTLNVGGLDRSRPDLFAGPASHGEAARQLMDSYVEMGCQPTFTCAPYQLPGRPAPGTDVAWAESNAIVFGNSMIGLRTDRYGDLIDICAAITGRVPHAGLHIRENRAARALFTVEQDAIRHGWTRTCCLRCSAITSAAAPERWSRRWTACRRCPSPRTGARPSAPRRPPAAEWPCSTSSAPPRKRRTWRRRRRGRSRFSASG